MLVLVKCRLSSHIMSFLSFCLSKCALFHTSSFPHKDFTPSQFKRHSGLPGEVHLDALAFKASQVPTHHPPGAPADLGAAGSETDESWRSQP